MGSRASECEGPFLEVDGSKAVVVGVSPIAETVAETSVTPSLCVRSGINRKEEEAGYVEHDANANAIAMVILRWKEERVGFKRGRDEPPSRRRRWIELPLLNDEDAPGWEDRIIRYFEIGDVLEEEWLSMAKMANEVSALSWFRSWEATAVVRSWRQIRIALVRQFQPMMAKNPFASMLAWQ